MIMATKNDVLNVSTRMDIKKVAWCSRDDPPLYKEHRQKDMGPDNLHYHWDLMEVLSCDGDE